MIKKLTLTGMHCAHCVRAVEDVLRQSNRVSDFSVTIGTAQITVPDSWGEEQELSGALAKEGFRVEHVETNNA